MLVTRSDANDASVLLYWHHELNRNANHLPPRFWSHQITAISVIKLNFSLWPSSCFCQVDADPIEPHLGGATETTKH